MKNKNKNSFFLFCCSLLPGAGEMYLGFMRQGISLMSTFWLIIAFSSWLNIGPFLFLLPVIWFYSFFHCHNLHRLPEEKFQAVPDSFLFGISDLEGIPGFLSRYHSIVAVTLIVLGISILWNTVLDALYHLLPDFLYRMFAGITNFLPRLAAGVFIIFLGLYFIRGKKEDLSLEDRESRNTDGEN